MKQAVTEKEAGTEWDLSSLRDDFPILRQQIHGTKRLAYLDNAATTQKPRRVICAVCDYYECCNSNVHRALHQLGEEATARYEAARGKVASFINAPATEQVVFTRGTTEAINLAAFGWGRRNIQQGDVILTTEMEHHSNLIPWQQLAREKGATLKYLYVDEQGRLDLSSLDELLSLPVKLAALTHVSNVLGTENPLQELIPRLHAAGARVLVDGAQSVPHQPVDVQQMNADFLAFSGHKMCAPTGIGVLYAGKDVLAEMDPVMFGGEMISRVTLESSTWAEIPHKFEAGTPQISGAVGLGAAVDYLTNIGMETIHAHEQKLVRYMLDVFSEIPEVRVFGPEDNRGGAVSFRVEHVHPHDLSQIVDQEGVAIRAGHLCAQPLMEKLNEPAVSRASLYFYNTEEDIDQCALAIRKAIQFFK